MTLGMGEVVLILYHIAGQGFPEMDYQLPEGMSQRAFKAMGTTISLLLPEAQIAQGTELIEVLFEEWEQIFSRFRPSSELSHVNRLAGQRAIVSKTFFLVLQTALQAAEASDGIYDPTLLKQLMDLGYDRSFDHLASELPEHASAQTSGGTWRQIQIEPGIQSVLLPQDIQLDFGGIAKGMAVDAAIEELRKHGIAPALVNGGGDLRVDGVPPGTKHWILSVPGKEEGWTLPFRSGAMATSGMARRQWRQGKVLRHHLLDPRNGLPVDNGLWSVTAVASTCTQAEIAAKVAFILGAKEGKKFLEKHDLTALFIHTNGTWETGGDWPMHLMRRFV